MKGGAPVDERYCVLAVCEDIVRDEAARAAGHLAGGIEDLGEDGVDATQVAAMRLGIRVMPCDIGVEAGANRRAVIPGAGLVEATDEHLVGVHRTGARCTAEIA